MVKKIYYLHFVLTLLTFLDTQAQWINSTNFKGWPITCFASIETNLLAGTNGSGLLLSTDNGMNWNQVSNGLNDTYFTCFTQSGSNLYLGSPASNNGVYLSVNNGNSWVSLHNGLPSPVWIFSLVSNGSTIFAGSSDRIYRSTNNGTQWISTNLIKRTESLAILGSNIFAGTESGIYMSSDNGVTWINRGLSGSYIRSLVTTESDIFAGTDAGVFHSIDNGVSWNSFNIGLTSKTIRTLIINGPYIIAGTNGGGIFISTINGTYWTPFNSGLAGGYSDILSLYVLNQNIFAGVDIQNGLYTRSLSDIAQMNCQLIITVNPALSGTINGMGSYLFGTQVTVSASASLGYGFLNWSENGNIISTNSNFTFIVNGSRTLIANFLNLPISPTCQAATSINQTSFYANWDSVSTATGYKLDIAIDTNFNNILSSYNNKDIGNITSYLVTGLMPATTFYYRVRASNAVGTSPSSNVISVTTLPNAPVAPTALAATNKTQTGFIANWSSSTGATGYYIDIAIDPNFSNKLINFNNQDVSNVTFFQVTGLTTNMTYYYRVRAYNNGGVSSNSNIITTSLTTGLEDISILPTSFNLYQNYPNPFNPTTTINYSVPKNCFVTIKIYDVLGLEIKTLVNSEKSIGIYSIEFNSEGISSGIYFCRMQAGDFIDTKKLILLK
ncbi:MAG: fibronectin type III domain-containing protein [Bacteroidetes bacterium]|nr:fibronectin type III domain-containing protein [Bacteroidota bacterium]MCL6100593.1 fibronectin type III domain-containing protein [Bacteroidota bacterium]